MANESEIQSSEYRFPYHHLPENEGGAWLPGRSLPWGHEYLMLLECAVNLIVKQKASAVLDFGCGDGRLLSELQHHPIPTLVGLDVDNRALRFAQAFTDAKRVRFYSTLTEIKDLAFDVITAIEVFEHIEEVQLPIILSDLHALLTPSGILIISVPSANIPVSAKHHRHYDAQLIRQHLLPFFTVLTVEHRGRIGFFAALLRAAFCNRLFALRSYRIARFLTPLARRFLIRARSNNCSNLIAVCAKRAL